jgi:tRNA-splicing ligase RtcB
MIHCGSRNIGKQVCDFYNKKAKRYMEIFYSNCPKDLEFLPIEVPEYAMYLKAMRFCMDFAEENRALIADTVAKVFSDAGYGYEETLRFDTHHNFAALEHHGGDNLMIHRKGAVKAEGMLTIPGSMGTASYICEGLKPTESFNTCSHGAGRVIGRKEANRKFTHEQAVESMKNVVFGIKQGSYDEVPMCYKDIDNVIKNQSDLVKPIYRLIPLAVVKG